VSECSFDPRRTGLLVEIMQNDIASPEGEFWQHGLSGESVQQIIPNLRRVCQACKAARVPIIATRLTVLTNLEGRAVGLGHLASLRPFLAEAGLREGSWGHQLVDDLPQPDYLVRKRTYNSFYQTDLEFIVQALELNHLVLTGTATNVAIESTGREAVTRGIRITTLSDGVSGYSERLHEASLANLANFGSVATCDELIGLLASR
jgi:ureidoacrylate peracid hydrolase